MESTRGLPDTLMFAFLFQRFSELFFHMAFLLYRIQLQTQPAEAREGNDEIHALVMFFGSAADHLKIGNRLIERHRVIYGSKNGLVMDLAATGKGPQTGADGNMEADQL